MLEELGSTEVLWQLENKLESGPVSAGGICVSKVMFEQDGRIFLSFFYAGWPPS